MPSDFDDGITPKQPSIYKSFTRLAAIMAMVPPLHQDKGNPLRPDQINLDIPTIVPKGCREYWFNEAGEAHWMDGNEYKPCRIHRADVIFKCVASNEKNAIRKFKNRK